MKKLISFALVLGACLLIGERLWTIAAASGMILAALALTGRKAAHR